jgi:hypothetical protein
MSMRLAKRGPIQEEFFTHSIGSEAAGGAFEVGRILLC